MDEVGEKLRALGVAPPKPPAPPKPEGALTRREIEIARLVARHKSNREIGEALRISDRTVGTHLANIYTKLGIKSRGELADYVREHKV
jgi:DNA-binding CsgD family transcriptional regulator